jgi:hypothetical protein
MNPIDLETYYENLKNQYPEQLDPQQVFNQGTPQNQPALENIYYNLITWLLIICGIIAVLSFIYGGVMYITSSGDTEKAERGKKTIVGSIIGIVIIMLSYSAYNFIMGTLK